VSDYQKADKVIPGICFLVTSSMFLGLGTLLMIDIIKVEQLFDENNCAIAVYSDTINYGVGTEGSTWVGMQNLTNQIYQFNAINT
jgi:hypothetical protein